MTDQAPIKTDDKIIPKTVTMYQEHWDVVDEVDAHFGFRNLSAAIRYIVTDYRRRMAGQSEPSSTTTAGATTAQ